MSYCKYRLSTTALLLTLASGCSVAPYQPAQAPVEERTPAVQSAQQPAAESIPAPESASSEMLSTPVPAPQPRVTQSPAVIALLDDAASYQQKGDYRSAQNSLQRAQRIAPRAWKYARHYI